jgi:hypothetical protein
MLDCQIVGLAQDMDFEENVSQTFLVVQLSNGERVRAAIDDATAQKVVELQVQARGVPRSVARVAVVPPKSDDYDDYTPAPPGEFTTAETAEGTVRIFGGQDAAEAEDTADYAEPPEGVWGAAPDNIDLPVIEDPDPEPARRAKDKSPKRTARQAQSRAVEDAHAPKAARTNLFRTAAGKLIAPSRTIPKNEAGYPQVANNGVDPEEFTGAHNQDEDGVGSI